MAVILSVKDLGFSFGSTPVLEQISFEVEEGLFYAVLGRNGSGKTTLIHCLNRILSPVVGRIELLGKNLSLYSRKGIAQLVSLVPQEHMDIFPYSVLDVVVMGRAPFLKTAASPSTGDYRIAQSALADLNAVHLAPKNFNRISGGERQIALLARAIAQSTRIMLLDEPTNHLDFNNQFHLLASIKEQCRTKGISIVASMHDPNLASFFADRAIMIKNGGILAQGDPEQTMTAGRISTLYETKITGFRPNGRQTIFYPRHIVTGPSPGREERTGREKADE